MYVQRTACVITINLQGTNLHFEHVLKSNVSHTGLPNRQVQRISGLADADVGSRIQQHCNGLVLVTQPGRRHGVGEPIVKTAGTYGLGLWQNPSVRPIDTAKHKRVARSKRIDLIQEAHLETQNAKPNDLTGAQMLSQKGTPVACRSCRSSPRNDIRSSDALLRATCAPSGYQRAVLAESDSHPPT